MAALDVVRSERGQAAVLVDFDGTLAPIVDDPAEARPLPGIDVALLALHAVYGCVAVVSGRPLDFLEAHLPDEIELSGLYGFERRRNGVRAEHPGAAGWRPAIDDAVAAALRDLPGEVEVEHKGLSLTLHVRRHPDVADVARAWAEEAATTFGLRLRPARMSVELHPPVHVDKGTVVDELVGHLTAACYIGDDVGDLPAFDALDRLEARGGAAVRAVVESPELDPAMLARADVILPGPVGVRDLLESLL